MTYIIIHTYFVTERLTQFICLPPLNDAYFYMMCIHKYLFMYTDLWTCDRKTEDIDVWTMENEFLKVTITPQYAGIL